MDGIRFHNSLTKQVEPFTPAEQGKVTIYNCGPTVYKRQHIGNMRRFLFADFLKRSLTLLGYEVKDITNITDVGHLTDDATDSGEDKLEKVARELKQTPQEIAETQTKLFFEDIKKLNIIPSTLYPKATKHIKAMQDVIAVLLEKSHAYKTDSGVYFDVQSFPAYGALSGNTVEQLHAGARVEVRGDKKHPADFALWVFDVKQAQLWDSPWGKGYPGWHIECSAMALEYLSSHIDIHTGGEDNKFPHHENEIAQSESATGEKFVTMWLHNGHLQLNGQKLSKREGEQITLDTLQEKEFSPLALRLLVFASHYRMKMDFSWELLKTFADHLASIKQALRLIREQHISSDGKGSKEVLEKFEAALSDDLNTPQAWAIFLQELKDTNQDISSPEKTAVHLSTLHEMDKVIGVMAVLEKELDEESIPTEILELVKQRDEAKAAQKYEAADTLRINIEKAGYKLEDTPHGTRVVKL